MVDIFHDERQFFPIETFCPEKQNISKQFIVCICNELVIIIEIKC